MALNKILDEIRRIKAELTANRQAEALRISFDQLALTKLRIQTRGESAAGGPFAPYVPAYAKERKAAGYQAGYVDFTRTGRLWAGIAPQVESSNVFSATVVIRATSQQGEDILAGQARKRGNVLTPSRAELDLVRAANRQRIRKAFGLT